MTTEARHSPSLSRTPVYLTFSLANCLDPGQSLGLSSDCFTAHAERYNSTTQLHRNTNCKRAAGRSRGLDTHSTSIQTNTCILGSLVLLSRAHSYVCQTERV